MVVIPTTEMRTSRKKLGWDSAEDDRSRDRSVILSTQVRLDKDVNTASHVNLLDQIQPETNWRVFRQPHTILLSSCLINAWKGHWYSEWLDSRPFTSEAKIEVNDGRMWCSAQMWLRMRGFIFFVWNFAWDRLVSWLYAATATTFLMKIYIYIIPPGPINPKAWLCWTTKNHLWQPDFQSGNLKFTIVFTCIWLDMQPLKLQRATQ